ncbi:MAG: hypothetical protein IKE60_34590 [Reyranella sp.]|uniref:hypothetical protein n=1 Tax=Reyranella sp. TaxID=1929291 RepID=UPI0025D1547D|nr:hypothetical protein [Reyranella sp.]MBR2819850.1 hypothetical protein [Reyranella sp.]
MPHALPILISIGVSIALSVGMKLIQSLFAKPQQESYGGQLQSADSGTKVLLRRAGEPKNIVFGTTRVQGNIVFAHSTHNNYLLHLIVEWAGHQISGYGDLYFGDELVSLSSGAATGKYASLVYLNDYLGTDDQLANPNLMGYAPDKWTAAHRGRGVAYSYITLLWDRNKFPQGLPNMWRVLRGMPLYDPRTGTTGYSDNAALAVAAWLNNKRFGRGVPYSEIDLDALAVAANVCDEVVPLADGTTEKRYTCNGVLKANTPFIDNLEKLLSASLGRASFIGGKWVIDAAAWKEPEFSAFTLGDFRDGFSLQTLQPKSESFNAIKGQFYNPARNYQKDDFPAITSAAYEAEDGGDREFKDVFLEMTNSGTMCQRIARVDLRKVRQPIAFSAPMKLRGMRSQVGDVEPFTIPYLGWSTKPFEVKATKMILGFAPGDTTGQMGIIGVDLELRETAEAIYDRDTNEERLQDPAPATNLPNLFEPLPPSSLFAFEEMYDTRSSAGVKVRARLSWVASPDAFVERYLPMMRKVGETDWRKLPVVEGLNATIEDIEPGQWQFAVAGQNLARVLSDPVIYLLEILGLGAPPTEPLGLSGRVLGSIVLFEWNSTPDLDVRIGGHFVARHTATLVGATWEGAVPIGKPFPGASGGGVLAAVAGTYLFKTRDSSGQYSINTATWVVDQVGTGEWTLLDSLIEHSAFTGAKTACAVSGGKLVLNTGAAAGAYLFSAVIDLGAVISVRVSASMASAIVNINSLWDSDEWVDSEESWDQNVSGNEAGAQVMVRKTNDNPTGAPTWSDWQPLSSAQLVGRGFQFRLDLVSHDLDYTIEVSELVAIIEQRV